MSHNPDCIFCKIIKGDLPSAKVFENEFVYAFMDISQVTKGHTLVIPKAHQVDIFELEPEIACQLFSVVPMLANAIKEQLQPLGLNIVNNNGKMAGQAVFHYHLHLIPRYGQGDGYGGVWKDHSSQYSPEDLQKISSTIAQGIK